ncbi:hypothetical protein D1AOALGA4SA_8735 [Olavius algarvensis Delta 1 endosymbiont]|nr:hypothetical protein D1AOALGA4SA_8735 [Olavius algarvensis Delta 1 endosymbiont]
MTGRRLNSAGKPPQAFCKPANNLTEVAIIRYRYSIFLSGLLFIAGLVPLVAEAAWLTKTAGGCDTGAQTERLAAEFRSFRSLPGHFSNGPWTDEVDRWMGRKHRLMRELGLRLGDGEYSRARVTKWLGPPDQIARKGDRLFDLIIRLPGYSAATAAGHEFMVYSWRGMHDFLFFTSEDGMIVGSDWWHAGD